jgi:hypothetical protein
LPVRLLKSLYKASTIMMIPFAILKLHRIIFDLISS